MERRRLTFKIVNDFVQEILYSAVRGYQQGDSLERESVLEWIDEGGATVKLMAHFFHIKTETMKRLIEASLEQTKLKI